MDGSNESKTRAGADLFISVIAPLHNDADIVASFVDDIAAVLQTNYSNYEIVLVDDGSSDDTVAVVDDVLTRHRRVRLLRMSRRFGQEIAISAGLDSVIGDFVVVMLPDSDPPTLVPDMIDQCRQGAEIVFGIRKERSSDPLFLRLGSRVFYWWCNHVLEMDIAENSTHFRVLSRRAVNALTRIRDRSRYLRTLSQYVGYENRGFEYDLVDRRPKRRVKSLHESLRLAIDIVVSNTIRPLRLASGLGLIVAVAYTVYVLTVEVRSFQEFGALDIDALATAILFLLLFVAISVIAEYTGRIVDETRDRPLYYVLDEHNSNVLVLDDEDKNVVARSTDEISG